MTGSASSLFSSVNDAGVTIKIKKPSVNTARAIRDAILRDYFGYTENDIKELDAQQPDKFFICVAGGDGNREMTPQQVSGWLPDSSGMISTTLNSYWLKNLSAFRERRVTFVLNQAVGTISNAEVRAKILGDLQKLFSPSESERITALNNLLTETGGTLDSSAQILAAVSHLTDRAGYQDNPLLILVKANAAFTEYRTKSGPGYDINARTLLTEAVRKANSDFIFGSDQSAFSLSRGEAAFVSRHASSLHKYLGDDKEARERDWAARFFEVGDDERAAVDEGDMIEFISPVTAMSAPRPPSTNEKDLTKLNEDFEQLNKTWSDTDKIGSQMVPTDHRAGELYQNPTDKYDVRKLRQERGRFRQSGKSLKYNVVMLNENPYSKANVYADGYGAIFELPLKLAKYVNTFRRLYKITEYINKRDKLLRQIKNENRYVVPPKPQEVEMLVKQVQRFGRVTASPSEKNQALVTLRDLERLWEESNAFWKGRK